MPRCYACGRTIGDASAGAEATVVQVGTSIRGVRVRERRYPFHVTCLAARRRRDRRRAARFSAVLLAVTVSIALVEWQMGVPPALALLVAGLGTYFAFLVATEVRAIRDAGGGQANRQRD